MQQSHHPSALIRRDIIEILHLWHRALTAARASAEAELYGCVIALALEGLDRYTTVQDLVNAYRSPDSELKTHVLALCGEGEVQLEPWIVMGSACALQFRRLMEKAIV